MAKNNLKLNQTKIAQLSKDDAGKIVFWRILIIAVVDLIIGSLYDYIIHSPAEIEGPFYMNVRPTLNLVFWGLFAAAVIYLVITLIKKIDTSAHIMTPAMICGATLFPAVLTVARFYNMFKNPYLFYTMMILVSILFAVYYIYTILLYKK